MSLKTARAQTSLILDKSVSIEFQEVPLTTALNSLERQVGGLISYSADVLDPHQRVSGSFKNEKLSDVLYELLKSYNISLKEKNSTIYILAESIKGTLSGKIYFADGKPAEGVSIRLKDTRYGTPTDSDGLFSFAVPSGKYIVTLSFLGVKKSEHQVTIRTGKKTYLDLIIRNDEELIQQVVVNEQLRKQPSAPDTSHAARLPLRDIENPYVYSTIPHSLIEDQVIINSQDLYKNASGVSNVGDNSGGGITSTQTTIRGFPSTAQLRNGLLTPPSFIDPALIEKVEVIKGPSSTLYGSYTAGNGGIVNTLTKQAMPSRNFSLGYTTGSWALHRFTADLNIPLIPSKLYVRLNSATQSNKSFREQTSNKSIMIAPSILYKASKKLTIHIDLDYYKRNYSGTVVSLDNNMLQQGQPFYGKSWADISYDPSQSYSNEALRTSLLTFNMYFNSSLKLSDRWVAETYYTIGHTERLPQSQNNIITGDGRIARRFNNTPGWRDMQQIVQNFSGDFKIGRLRNRLAVGVSYLFASSRSFNAPNNGIVLDTINMLQQSVELPIGLLDSVFRVMPHEERTSTQRNQAVYFTNMSSLTQDLQLMLGLRVDKLTNENYKQASFSPMVGISYQVVPQVISFFGNYLNGYNNNQPTISNYGEVFNYKPSQLVQLETGLKFQFKKTISMHMSYYFIKNSDILRPNPTDPLNLPRIQNGVRYSEGIDMEFTVVPLGGLPLQGGYAYNNSKFLRMGDTSLNGKTPLKSPHHIANLWADYKFATDKALSGFGIASGANYTSRHFYNDANTFTMPASMIFNGSIFYDIGLSRVSLKINNITNREYWVLSGQPTPMPPREFLLHIMFKF